MKHPNAKHLAIFAASLAGTQALVFSGVHRLYRTTFRRTDKRNHPPIPYSNFRDHYPRETFCFRSGENNLQAYLYGLSNDKGLVIVVHGIHSNADRHLADITYFVDHGWRVLAYDGTACGASEGDSLRGLVQSALDLHALLQVVEKTPSLSSLPIMLFGHSWGGFAVTAVLNFNHQITGVVSISGYNSASEMTRENSRNLLRKAAPLTYLPSEVFQMAAFGQYSSLSAVNGINRAKNTAVFLMHGDHDETVSYKGASIISHRSQITNPHICCHTFTEEGQNTHSGVFCSMRAVEYRKQWQAQCDALKKKYKVIPDDVWRRFCAQTDTALYYERNDDLFDSANQFFENLLQ
ncbi:MAG: alpha/beta hydrolase [Butyricicoccaceae bacterium]